MAQAGPFKARRIDFKGITDATGAAQLVDDLAEDADGANALGDELVHWMAGQPMSPAGQAVDVNHQEMDASIQVLSASHDAHGIYYAFAAHYVDGSEGAVFTGAYHGIMTEPELRLVSDHIVRTYDWTFAVPIPGTGLVLCGWTYID